MQAERVPFQRFAAVLGRVVAQSTAAATDAALKRAGDELAQSAEAALSSGSFVGYLSLVVPHLGLLFKGDTASQALSLYQLVISAFRAADVQASDKLVGLVNTFVGGVFVDAPVGSGSLVRLSVLSSLYLAVQGVPAAAARVLLGTVVLARAARQHHTLGATVAQIKQLLASAELSSKSKFDLNMCLSQLASDRNDVDGELNHRTQAAVSWTEADAKAMSADDTQTVVSTVAQVLSSVSMNNIDVLRSSATVQRLVAAHKHAAALQDLTKVLSSGTLADFDAAASKHAAALKELGVDAARVRSRLRLLSLAALPTGVPLAFTEVAKRLDGPVDGVETSVVEAVRLGIIDARIDQLQSTVVVMRSIPRVFEKKEWESLLAMLGNCEQDLQTQMRALKTAVEHHEQHVQAQLASAAAARS